MKKPEAEAPAAIFSEGGRVAAPARKIQITMLEAEGVMSVTCIARQRVQDAQRATEAIDRSGLWEAVERLQDAGQVSNGAGVFCDVSRFKSALADAAAEIAHAQKIMSETEWPSDRDYEMT